MSNYKILVLGPRGSGKTVFLSSMYYKMSMPNDKMFYIEPNQSINGRKLKHMYANLIDGWPSGTAFDEISEWDFSCMIHTGYGNHKAFDIVYYDYSGGRIDNPNQDDGGELECMVKDADILLGIIDGQKLIKAMKNEGSSRRWIIEELDGVLSLIGREHAKQQPIHFLISKWDLIKDKYKLIDINNFLLNIPNFKSFVQNVCKNDGLVRLVPVSSVGFNFIDYDKSNGEMLIKDDGILEPFQVEYPMALALLDKFRVHYDYKLKEYREKEIDVEREIEQNSFSWKSFWGGILRSIGSILEDTETFENLGRYWRSSGEQKLEETQKELNEFEERLRIDLSKVEDEQTALKYAINAFYELQLKLDIDYPGSLVKI